MLNGQSKRWTPGTSTNWTDVAAGGPGLYDGFWSTSVLLPLMPDDDYRARVLQCGDEKAVLLDFGTTHQWEDLGPRSDAAAGRKRVHATAVLLPSAEVFVCGGVEDIAKDSTAVLDPELLVRHWSAERQEWIWRWSNRPLAAATVPRNYHSTALLMPDGRVWTAGGSIDSKFGAHNPPSRRVRRLEVEIYEPWYYCAERPIIREWPSSVRAGQRIVVRVKSGPPVTRLAIIRAGSVTHSFNGDQRYVGLADLTRNGDVYVAKVPAAHLAIPGYYLLVACTKDNVPSVGQFMQVRP